MATSTIFAVDGTIEVDAPETRVLRQRSAAYTTKAAAARLAKGGQINRLEAWVRATHARAVDAPGGDLWSQMDRWASASKDRHALLGPVCDLLLLRIQRDRDPEYCWPVGVPDPVHLAAFTLFGHDVGRCGSACDICNFGRCGDWPRALRLVVGDYGEIVAAALTDGYRAARRGGLVPAVQKVLDPDAGVTLVGPTSADPKLPGWYDGEDWPL